MVVFVCDGKQPDADRIASVLADTERADDYEVKIARLQEKLPALWRKD